MSALADEWQRYAAWLEANASPAARTLKPPADDSALHRVETALGVPLPAELREFYRIHDGQPWEDLWVFPDGQWMPLEQVAQALGQVRVPDVAWPGHWLPFVFDGGASYIAMDCGTGAVHVFWFDDEPEQLADSLSAWLRSVADRAEAGTVFFDAEQGVTTGQ